LAHKLRLCDPREGNDVALTWIRTHDWDADDWRLDASCRDSNPDLFFPIGTTGIALDQIDAAKVVCESCPVSRPCLEFALATNQEAGVWGATTEEERRKLRKSWLADQRRVG
jgi:WhiB family redox-sensing transcriptional regulator